MKPEDKVKFKEIRRILDKLHKDWRDDPESDGHCKSSEGYISITHHYPNWFEAVDYVNCGPDEMTITIYSYLFGPSRMHDFNSFDDALEAVKGWATK